MLDVLKIRGRETKHMLRTLPMVDLTPVNASTTGNLRKIKYTELTHSETDDTSLQPS